MLVDSRGGAVEFLGEVVVSDVAWPVIVPIFDSFQEHFSLSCREVVKCC